MKYTSKEVLQFVAEEDVKFVRMAFCDVYGVQKNMAVMAGELPRVFAHGAAIDASAIDGFGGQVRSDLLLRPDPSTLIMLPWRPQHGRVAHMFCDIVRPDGAPFAADVRQVLKDAVNRAAQMGCEFFFGTEMEFYLFRLDEGGMPTTIPCDNAGYMDIAPEDRGENVRREICLTLEQMGIRPESSHHECGPGQNEIDFQYADPMSAADNAVMFRAVVRTVAAQNGLWADFSPRPLPEHDGSGMHINISAKRHGRELAPERLIPGLLARIREMTLFLNPTENSYSRLGRDKAPACVAWGAENRTQLIRLPAASGKYHRTELRSPDPSANPYLAFALVIHACLDGLEAELPLPAPADFNAFTADADTTASYERLPSTLRDAAVLAAGSDFIRRHIPEEICKAYSR